MAIRKKSRLERLLSFNQHRKRIGAGQALNAHAEIETMKNSIIDSGEQQYTRGSKKRLSAHLEDLRVEFHGQSELSLHHATLIVLIRREADVKTNWNRLRALWDGEHEWLLQHLDLRWIISAADTFVDHDDDAASRSLAMACICLVNTVKMAETERWLSDTQDAAFDAERVEQIQAERVALFDGTSGFTVGTDDTLRNMRWRIESLKRTGVTGAMLLACFDRLQQVDNTYRRFRNAHTRDRTAWWDNSH